MADHLYIATKTETVRLDDGRDYVIREGDTELAEGHPLVKARPDLFESPAEPKQPRRRRRP